MSQEPPVFSLSWEELFFVKKAKPLMDDLSPRGTLLIERYSLILVLKSDEKIFTSDLLERWVFVQSYKRGIILRYNRNQVLSDAHFKECRRRLKD
jgi:hypothetical protein